MLSESHIVAQVSYTGDPLTETEKQQVDQAAADAAAQAAAQKIRELNRETVGEPNGYISSG